MKEYSKLYFDLQRNVSSNFDLETIKKGIVQKINTEPSTYEDLKREVRRAIKLTKDGVFIDETRHSLFVYGETGSGKSEKCP